MRRTHGFFISFLAVFLVAAAPARGETLTQAVAGAMQHFPEIRSAQHREEAVKAQTAQARSELYPQVNLSAGRGSETSRNVSTSVFRSGERELMRTEADLNLVQLLWDGGAVSSQVRRFTSLAESAGLAVFDTAENVGLRAGQAFVEVQRLREQLGIARENVGIHNRTLGDVKEIADLGRGRRADVVQAEARQALAVSSLDQISAQLAQTEIAYRHFVGRPPGILEPVAPVSARLPARLDEAVARALERHPAVQAAEKDLQAAQYDHEGARNRMASPRITLEAGATENRNIDGIVGSNADRTLMMRMRYNIFRGFGDSERVRETGARIDQAVSELTRARNEVERDVRQAWENLVSDRARLPVLEQYARASADVAEAYRLQFQLGQRTLLDVLNAENERFNAMSGAIAGRAGVLFAELRLLASMGLLLETLGVAVPERKTEPTREAVTGMDALGARSTP